MFIEYAKNSAKCIFVVVKYKNNLVDVKTIIETKNVIVLIVVVFYTIFSISTNEED